MRILFVLLLFVFSVAGANVRAEGPNGPSSGATTLQDRGLAIAFDWLAEWGTFDLNSPDDPIIPAALLGPKKDIKNSVVLCVSEKDKDGKYVTLDPDFGKVKAFKIDFDKDGRIDLLVDGAQYFAGPQRATCPVHICRDDGCYTPVYRNVSDTQILDGIVDTHTNPCPATAEANTTCRKECAATVEQCPALFNHLRNLKWSGRLFDASFISVDDFLAYREERKNQMPDKRYIYRANINTNPIFKAVRHKSFCNLEEMDINHDGTVSASEPCIKLLQYDSDAAACSGVNDGCFIDLYQPTVITGTSETDVMFIDSLIAGDTGADFFDRSKRSLARGQTMGDGVGFRLRANYSIAAQIPDFDANAGKEVCKTVEYDETVCDEDDFGRQTVGDVGNSESKKCYVIKKTKKVCEKPTPKTEFLCREYYNRSAKDVFIPAETDMEYQSFISAVTNGEVQDVSILECQRKFTPWVGITTCAAVNPACDQVVTIAAERKCQRSTSAYGSCDECAQYGAADNERIPGHPANTCYFSKECRGEPCPTGNGGENFCLVADTKIAMADGTEKDILDVKIGDVVKAFDSKDALKEVKTAKVKSVMITGDQQPIALNDLKITGIHKVILEGGKLIEAKEVKIGDKIVKADGTLLEVTKITKDLKPVTVYNLDVEGFDGYIAGGLRVMDYPAPDSK